MARGGQRPCYRAAILPESVGMVKRQRAALLLQRQRAAGRGPRTPWRAGGCGQTTARAGGPVTSRREREEERGLVVSRGETQAAGAGSSAWQAGSRSIFLGSRRHSSRLKEVQGLLGRHTPHARLLLTKLLTGKIEMTPVHDQQGGYHFRGALALDRLIEGETHQLVSRWWPQPATHVGRIWILAPSSLSARPRSRAPRSSVDSPLAG